MKILFTTHKFFPDVGGIESHSEILARYLANKGHEILLVTQSCGDPSDDLTRFPFSVLRRPTPAKLWTSYRCTDIVFQNNIELGTLWPWFLNLKPLVISIHTWIRDSHGKRRLVDLLKLCVLRLAKRVIIVSEILKADSIESAFVIPNPYNETCFYELPNTTRDRAIVFLGRLVSEKAVDILLEAFNKIRADPKIALSCYNQGIELRLTIVGSGPEEGRLRKTVQQNGLNGCVEFVGVQSGHLLMELLNRHTILVLPSRCCETFGMVILEGMACGCVVVGSNSGGIPVAVGQAGLLFEKGNAESLAAQLNQLLLNPQMIVDLRSKASIHLAMHHTNVVCSKYMDIFYEILQVKK